LQELLELDTLSVVEEMRPFSVLNIPLKRFGKAGKAFLKEIEGLEVGSPKGVIPMKKGCTQCKQ